MWLKVGTRGDYRVIYVIVAFYIFLELHSAYNSLYNLNNGPEKQKLIVREVDIVMPITDEIRLQRTKVTEHIGGSRDFEETLFTALSKEEVYRLFKENAEKNAWQAVDNGQYFVKDNMKMSFKYVDISEYNNAKHLIGKTIFRIRVEIK
ncbi:hypothetical protein [uncultured Phascolarctobacterium sp.]|uniref:hypothetical protein n=1 Tax=uncultured Phascolarctobacterium sp. TaxID=512296 RepID=UPI0025EC8A65|nr:hypothetical protein [uncultured Phascolarctobacterium sp.]